MKPALALPYNDPTGTLFPHLQAILPDLKAHFERAYISPPPATQRLTQNMSQLQADEFFTIFLTDRDLPIGEDFHLLYQRAADLAHPDQVIHLAFLDRLSFALEGEYREACLSDIDSLTAADVPIIFQRSELAWATHPQNYHQLEGIVTVVGNNLFGRELDYAWCHIAATARHLRDILPRVRNPDLSMVAEMIFYLQEDIKTRDVDWLAWEDPFIFGRDPAELKQERENSLEETNKRLSYVLPMLKTLTKLSQDGRSGS